MRLNEDESQWSVENYRKTFNELQKKYNEQLQSPVKNNVLLRVTFDEFYDY